jgi:hypothetical protein
MQYAFACYVSRFGNPGSASPADALPFCLLLFEADASMHTHSRRSRAARGLSKQKKAGGLVDLPSLRILPFRI